MNAVPTAVFVFAWTEYLPIETFKILVTREAFMIPWLCFWHFQLALF